MFFFFHQVFYRNNTKIEVPMELKLPFCDDPCPYSQFVQHIDKLIPKDWEAECQNLAHWAKRDNGALDKLLLIG